MARQTATDGATIRHDVGPVRPDITVTRASRPELHNGWVRAERSRGPWMVQREELTESHAISSDSAQEKLKIKTSWHDPALLTSGMSEAESIKLPAVHNVSALTNNAGFAAVPVQVCRP